MITSHAIVKSYSFLNMIKLLSIKVSADVGQISQLSCTCLSFERKLPSSTQQLLMLLLASLRHAVHRTGSRDDLGEKGALFFSLIEALSC